MDTFNGHTLELDPSSRLHEPRALVSKELIDAGRGTDLKVWRINFAQSLMEQAR